MGQRAIAKNREALAALEAYDYGEPVQGCAGPIRHDSGSEEISS